jgi:lysophospholipase L1-like esterase
MRARFNEIQVMAKRPRLPQFLSYFFAFIFSCVFFLAAAEMTCRFLESRTTAAVTIENIPDPVLGWVPLPGRYHAVSSEYDAVYEVNAWGMNDRPIRQLLRPAQTRIMALGDSHTFAFGVSREEAWPKVLEGTLFKGDQAKGEVYNCAVAGYNLGQYYLRMKQLEEVVKPDTVIIGFSMATDLYDFLPPRMGGFIYGGGMPRTYFDLDDKGNLTELKYEPANDPPAHGRNSVVGREFWRFRQWEDSALFRRFKNSLAAVWLGMRLQNRHLFLGSDVAFKKEPDARDRYCWEMTEKLLGAIAREAARRKIKVVLVNIPYLAQVYDDIWRFSYGSMPGKYDRWIGGKRLAAICRRQGIAFIDTTGAFVKRARSSKARLHYAIDKHPTADGQRIIADTVAEFMSGEAASITTLTKY